MVVFFSGACAAHMVIIAMRPGHWQDATVGGSISPLRPAIRQTERRPVNYAPSASRNNLPIMSGDNRHITGRPSGVRA